MQEFSARIVCSIELKKYNSEQVRTILTYTKQSVYNKYLNLFGRYETLEPEEIDEIVKKVEENKNGLRELDSLLFEKYYEKRRNR
jgi:ATP-dependent protease Clp ATPase subunit